MRIGVAVFQGVQAFRAVKTFIASMPCLAASRCRSVPWLGARHLRLPGTTQKSSAELAICRSDSAWLLENGTSWSFATSVTS